MTPGFHVPEQAGNPLDVELDAARNIAECTQRTHHHQQVGKPGVLDAKEGLCPTRPVVLQAAAVDAADIHRVIGAGQRIEAGGINDHVEFALAGARADTGGRDALDRCLVQIDQLDIRLVVDLVVARLQRQASGAEAVVFRDELFSGCRVFHPLTNLARDEVRDQRIGLAVGQDVAIVADPDAEARLGIALLPEGFALFARDLERAARIGFVDESARIFAAALKDLGVAGLDCALLFVGDFSVVKRCAPVGGALKDGEMRRRLGNLLDRLDTGRAGTDHRHALAFETHRLVRPLGGMARNTLEALDAVDQRQRGHRERADRGDQKTCAQLLSVIEAQLPDPCGFLPVGRAHASTEHDVAAQIELVGHISGIAQGLGLRGEMLRPVPLVKQFL